MPEQMVRCNRGHFYSPAQHSSCPYCGVKVDLDKFETQVVHQPGAAAAAGAAPGASPGPAVVPPQAAESEPGVTRVVQRLGSGVDPVVGWLVCVVGPDKGRDFRIHGQRNFIGRAPSMDIVVEHDDSVSRDKHAIVTYEPRKNEFWLAPGESSGLVYLNSELVNGPERLKARDIVEIGRTRLMFFPLCDEQFRWS
ncbi:MAG TPA: FHA domain-containing protein [Candidatus Binataceae bacterium]|nr:FHA domain-containing protein [Candidatus Binataceae bacterium]